MKDRGSERRRFVLAVIASLGGALVPKAWASTDSAWDRILQTGVVRVGVIPNRPPYFWDENHDRIWRGFNASMSRDATSALSASMRRELKIEWVESNFTTIVLDLQSGKIDFFLGMTATPERVRALSMFGPLWFVPNVALNRTGFHPGDTWESYNDPKYKVSVVMGSTDETAARKFLTKPQIRSMKGMAEAVLDVESGNSDALITSVFNGLGALKSNSSLGEMVTLLPPYALPSGGGMRKDDDGRLLKFLQHWSEDYRKSGQSQKRIYESMAEAKLPTDRLPKDIRF